MNRSEEYPLVCPMNCPMCLAPFNDVKTLQRHLHDVHFWPVHGTFVHRRKCQLCHFCQQSTDQQQSSLKKLIFETLLECTFHSTKKHCTCIDVVLAILFCYQNSTFWLFRITKEVDCSEVWSERVNCAFDIFIQRLKIKLRYHWWHEIFNEVKLHSNTTVFVYDEGPSTSKRPSTNQWFTQKIRHPYGLFVYLMMKRATRFIFFAFSIFEYCKLTLGSPFAIFEPWIWLRIGPVPASFSFERL